MIETADKQRFQEQVTQFATVLGSTGVADASSALSALIQRAVAAAQAGDVEGAEPLYVTLARVGFVTPEAIMLVYDTFTRAWLGMEPDTLVTPPQQAAAAALLVEPSPLPETFWDTAWGVVRDAGVISAAEITTRVSALNGLLPPAYGIRAEAAARLHPGVTGPAERPIPERLTLAALAAQPEGSLGHAFYRLIVDNRFDLEVLDRDAVGLQHLPPALRYLNTRILQMHDVWHLVAGYQTTGLHEVAISAFQLAQFDHNYSAMFLAVIGAWNRFVFTQGMPVMLQVVAEAWLHSRRSPAFMNIVWEEELGHSIGAIRAKYAIAPFSSVFPADIIEQVTAMQQFPAA